jgi:hypothetical protein
MKSRVLGLLVALVATLPMAAQAAQITFSFTGTITSISDPLNAFAGVSSGTTFSGSYTFDSTTADADSSATIGRYAGALEAFTLNIGAYSLSFPGEGSPNQIVVRNDVGAGGNIDTYNVLADFLGFGGYSDIDLLGLGGQGPNTVFGSDALPLTPDFFASLTFTTFQLDLKEQSKGTTGTLRGTLTSLTTTTSVPEPGVLGLLGLGLLGLGLMRRRRATV